MKAIVQDTYGLPDVLRLDDIDRPRIGRHDVLVRVQAAGVGPDAWHLMTGRPYLVRLAFGIRAPRNPVRGADLAGVVDAVGPGVTRLRPGDEVFGIGEGTLAEYARAPEAKLAPKPANLTFEQAAAVPISGLTALQALRDHAKVQPGQSVLVVGAAGGVGTLAVQLAKAFGAEVTGVCSTAKISLVRSLGADHVIDYTRDDPTAGTHRYDVVLDIAGARPLKDLRRVLTPRGTLVIIGGEGGGRWFGPLGRFLQAALRSPFTGPRLRGFVSTENHEDLLVLREHAEAGRLTPVVGRVFPLDQAADAVRHVAAGHARGKIVVSV